MNQMMGSSATSMSTIFNRFVNISPPGIDILNMTDGHGVGSLPPADPLIKISFRLTIGDLIDSTIMQLLTVKFAKEMVNSLISGSATDSGSKESAAAAAPTPAAAPQPSAPAYHESPAAPRQSYQAPPMHQPDPYQQPFAYGQPGAHLIRRKASLTGNRIITAAFRAGM